MKLQYRLYLIGEKRLFFKKKNRSVKSIGRAWGFPRFSPQFAPPAGLPV